MTSSVIDRRPRRRVGRCGLQSLRTRQFAYRSDVLFLHYRSPPAPLAGCGIQRITRADLSLMARRPPRLHGLRSALSGCRLALLKRMSMLNRCIDFLKLSRIVYSHSVHAPAYTARAAASADRMPAHQMAKTVVYWGDEGYGMLVLPADMVVDFDEVRRLLKLTTIRLASEEELANLVPDCATGAMPPFGNLFGMPVLMDETLATADFIAFSAGTPRDVIHISGDDFHRLVNPLVAGFAAEKAVTSGVARGEARSLRP